MARLEGAAFVVVLVACAMGLVWAGVAAIRRGREGLEERIPFGVALAAAI